MPQPLNLPIYRAATANNEPLSGALLDVFLTGTTTPATVYTTDALSVAHENPVEADAGGLFPEIYLDPAVTYRFRVRTADGANVSGMDFDPVSTGTGGTATFVETFADIAERNFDADVRVIRTAEYAEGTGLGAAEYVYDEDIDEAAVTADPLWKTLSANGRGFRLSREQTITPFMFGAVGWTPSGAFNARTNPIPTGCPDDTDAVQAFFDCLYLEDGYRGDGGDTWYGISEGIVAGPTTVAVYHPQGSFSGNMHLMALGEIDDMLTCRNMTGQWPWTGSIGVHGYGGEEWADRLCNNGIVIAGHSSHWGILGRIEPTNFRHAGFLKVPVTTADRMQWFNCSQVDAYACGSGKIMELEDENGLKANWSGPVDSGTATSSAQRTVLTVDQLPPTADIRNDGSNPRIAVSIDSRMYEVTAVGASTITIYPRLETAAGSSGELWYYFGGAVVEGGGDGGLSQYGAIAGMNCATAYNVFSFYPGFVGNVTNQNCGVGVWYRGFQNFQKGSHIGQLYNEAMYFDVFAPGASRGRPQDGAFIDIIVNGDGEDLSKFQVPSPWDGTTATEGLNGAGLGTLNIGFINGHPVRNRKADNDTRSVYLDGRNTGPSVWRHDTVTVFVDPPAAHLYRTTGVHNQVVRIIGSGTNGQPTGTITLNGVAGFAYSLNGGAAGSVNTALTFSSLKAMLDLSITYPGTGTTIYVVQNKGLAAQGSAVTAPSGGATQDAEARTAIGTLISRLQAAGIIA